MSKFNPIFLEDLTASNTSDEATLNECMERFLEEVNILNEKNVVKMDKKTLRKKAITRMALSLAQKAGDPAFDKYMKYSALRKHYRKLIANKYGSKATAAYRKYLQDKNSKAKED